MLKGLSAASQNISGPISGKDYLQGHRPTRSGAGIAMAEPAFLQTTPRSPPSL